MSIWQRYMRWRRRHVAVLELSSDGFAVDNGRDRRTCRWVDVQKITAFKRDLLSHDCICLLVLLNNDLVQMDEQMEGFATFREEMEREFDLAPVWWLEVAFPAFHTCEYELYSRADGGTC